MWNKTAEATNKSHAQIFITVKHLYSSQETHFYLTTAVYDLDFVHSTITS